MKPRAIVLVLLASALPLILTGCGLSSDSGLSCPFGQCEDATESDTTFDTGADLGGDQSQADTANPDVDSTENQLPAASVSCNGGMCITTSPLSCGASQSTEHASVTGPGTGFSGYSSGSGYEHFAGPVIPVQISLSTGQ